MALRHKCPPEIADNMGTEVLVLVWQQQGHWIEQLQGAPVIHSFIPGSVMEYRVLHRSSNLERPSWEILYTNRTLVYKGTHWGQSHPVHALITLLCRCLLPFLYCVKTSECIFQGAKLSLPLQRLIVSPEKLGWLLWCSQLICCNNKCPLNSIAGLSFMCFSSCSMVLLEVQNWARPELGSYPCSKSSVFQTLSWLNILCSKKYLQRCPVNEIEKLWMLTLGAFPAHCQHPPVDFTCSIVATAGIPLTV